MEVYLPECLERAAVMLASGNGKALAGGTDLIIELQKEEMEPDFLVDLSGIEILREINITEKKIRLGSMVTFGDIVRNGLLKSKVPALWEAARKMGACQIQNRATIGGNICNAAPAADSVPVLMALNAYCSVYGPEGERVIPAEAFLLGKGKTCLGKGELLKGLEFDMPGPDEGCGFAKLGKRNALAISTISCAVKIKVEQGRIKAVNLFTGSLGPIASREKNTEVFLNGKEIDMLEIDQAAEVLSKEVEERLGSRASIVYKKVAVKGIFKEALEKAIKDITRIGSFHESKGGGRW